MAVLVQDAEKWWVKAEMMARTYDWIHNDTLNGLSQHKLLERDMAGGRQFRYRITELGIQTYKEWSSRGPINRTLPKRTE
jgi:hypothetical protein